MSNKKPIIYTAFANSRENPLPTLKKEDEEVDKILSARNNSDFVVVRDSFATRASIVKNLIQYQDELIYFQYSGHAGRDRLLLEDDIANPKGIIKLLAACPCLKMIILNGCSTEGQVRFILEKIPNIEIVIYTSSEVKDEAATHYSIGFWKAFCLRKLSIGQAHEEAIKSAQVYTGKKIRDTRGLALETPIELDEIVWGILSYKESSLLNILEKYRTSNDGEESLINKTLREKLFTAFAKYNSDIERAIEDSILKEEDQVTKILEALPFPLSEQIRKLFSKEGELDEKEDLKFYNRIGVDRMYQMISAYKTMIETVVFIHLAQLWDEKINRDLKLNKDQNSALKKVFTITLSERKYFSLTSICYVVNKIFQEKGIKNFLEEWNHSEVLIDESHVLFNDSINYMQDLMLIDLKQLSDQDLERKCLATENHLANIYSCLSFIINYSMASVRGISVKKYRHKSEDEVVYKHTVVPLVANYSTSQKPIHLLEAIEEEDDKSKFTNSVLLLKKSQEKQKDRESLNLTPFIIDDNGFNPLANKLTKIYHFFIREKTRTNDEIYTFNHVYNRGEKLEIKNEGHYQIIKDQFYHFMNFVLNA